MITNYEAYIRREPVAAERDQWRRQLLALMAGERAILLEALLGLDEATLTGAEVFEGCSVRDLLAHIAAWDDFHRERMALVLAGKADEIAPIELHEHNEALHEAHQVWSLAESVAALGAARRRFLEMLAEAPDAVLHQPVSIPWADTLPLRTWAIWRARHDGVHGADVQRWRKGRAEMRQVGPKSLLVAALAASREEMGALAALVPDGEQARQPVYGEWTMRDVAGHVADWDQFALECLEAGEILDMGYKGEVLQWNEAHAAARREQSWAEAWADYMEVRRTLLALIDETGQSDLARTVRNPWGRDVTVYRFIHSFLEHEREHTEGLRAALLAVAS